MKILVITDCSERGVHYATTLYKNLSREIKDITFCIPMFMEYLIDTKIEPKYLSAFFYSLVSMKSVYKAAEEKNDDLIQKRLRTLVTGLANAGLEATQVSNDDLRIILDNFLNSGMTTNFGTVIS